MAGTGTMVAAYALTALAAYLLGSINFGVIVSKSRHDRDVRTLGSGNAGMTNILRNFGRKSATITLIGDVAKGMLAVLAGWLLFTWLLPEWNVMYGTYFAGVFAVLGHMYPIFFGFKGGKGVATSGGVILALQPVIALVLLSIFLILIKATGMVSLGSVVGMSLYPVATFVYAWFFARGMLWYATLCAAFIGGMVVWMHRENIGRIRAGTEYRFGQKNEAAPTPEDEEK